MVGVTMWVVICVSFHDSVLVVQDAATVRAVFYDPLSIRTARMVVVLLQWRSPVSSTRVVVVFVVVCQ